MGVTQSEYLENLAGLNVYVKPIAKYGYVNWNQGSDRAEPGLVQRNVPSLALGLALSRLLSEAGDDDSAANALLGFERPGDSTAERVALQSGCCGIREEQRCLRESNQIC